MKIVLDVYGGDHAPEEILKGASQAMAENKAINLVLVGKPAEIEKYVSEFKIDTDRIEIIKAMDVISNDDIPSSAIRSKPDSSLSVAFETVKNREDCCAVVSAGSSGAVLTAALLKLGRIKGMIRPCLVSTFPTIEGGRVLLADCGANVDSKPEAMAQYALVANEYAKKFLKIENPRVSLLNVGLEEGKGDERTKTAHEILKTLPINFIGNMESRSYISGSQDVIVADGFSGNVLMKATEGAALNILKLVKKAVTGSFISKIGGLLIKKEMSKVKKLMDYSKYGGAIFLGCKKIVIKCHGSSKANSIKVALLETFEVVKADLIKDIERVINENPALTVRDSI